MTGDLKMLNLTAEKVAAVEQKQHFFFRISMMRHVEDVGHLDFDAALLAAFANDGSFGRLPVFELSAGELPHSGEVLPVGATCEQHTAVLDHHRSCNEDEVP